MRSFQSVLFAALLAEQAFARSVPDSVRTFYNSIKSKGQCSNKLATGFYALDGGSNSFSYCGDHMADYNVVYLQGSSGQFADMDIDCDGTQKGAGDDGRCGSSQDTQSITSFADTVKGYGAGINDLNAHVHPYVVFGNEGKASGFTEFNPQSYGIQPLSLVAVVCGDKLIYGIWGDENGIDGDHSMVGEASISLATACFGTGVNGNAGYSNTDVLYIAFAGADAVPGKSGAKWNAGSYDEFENSITALGDKLIGRFGSTGSSTGGSTGGSTPTTTAASPGTTATKVSSPGASTVASTCSWAGHCLGATCSSNDDCSDDLVCTNKKCAN